MAFNGTEGSQVTLTEGAGWTKNYRDKMASGSKVAHFVGKDILQEILGQAGCMGIRIYYGEESNGTQNLVIVGAGAEENDMVNGIIAERCVPCPSRCGISNPLNS